MLKVAVSNFHFGVLLGNIKLKHTLKVDYY